MKDISEENYAVRRKLRFYACRMFSAKKKDKVSLLRGSRNDEMQNGFKAQQAEK